MPPKEHKSCPEQEWELRHRAAKPVREPLPVALGRSTKGIPGMMKGSASWKEGKAKLINEVFDYPESFVVLREIRGPNEW